MKHINCEQYAKGLLDRAKSVPHIKKLAIITVGNDQASRSYVNGKKNDCSYCGIPYDHIELPETTKADELIKTIQILNEDDSTCGIILQLPLPRHLGSPAFYTSMIDDAKDIDGFKPESIFKPCTPAGVIYLLEEEIGSPEGMKTLLIGRGELVGRPLIEMLLDKDCTLTIAHSKTKNMQELLATSDIIISAVGKVNLVDLAKCKAKIVIDVGVNRNNEGKLCGDCYNFTDDGIDMLVTPVPKGIGLLTRAMLINNYCLAEALQQEVNW